MQLIEHITTPMTEVEATHAESEIMTTGRRLRAMLIDFDERRGWEVLGHSSFRSWSDSMSGILGVGPRQLRLEHAAGQIEIILGSRDPKSVGVIPEGHLRPLTSLIGDPDLLHATWEDAHALAETRGEAFTARHVTEAVKAVTPTKQAVHFSSATPEHYTPRHIIDLARTVLHRIDLDPASCNEANQIVGATRWYGLDHPDPARRNGLAHSWYDRVWLNPPYGDEIGNWMNRLIHQYDMENTTEAIALIPSRTDTAWFHDAVKGRSLCFILGRLRFGEATNSAPFPSALVYFGEDASRFRAVFGEIGLIAGL